jgi:single-strand DNA-binding protein
MFINKAMIYGNLTRDPEMKALTSGQNVTNMSIATNRVYNDKDGNRQEDAEFHNVVVFGKQAENVAKYLSKGSSAYVEGRLQTRSWEKDGQKMYRTEVVADFVQFGPKGGGDQVQPKAEEQGAPEYPTEDTNEEDVPF